MEAAGPLDAAASSGPAHQNVNLCVINSCVMNYEYQVWAPRRPRAAAAQAWQHPAAGPGWKNTVVQTVTIYAAAAASLRDRSGSGRARRPLTRR